MDGPDSLDRVLNHYGVKGMHWGVRRTDAQLARAAKKRAASSDDANTVRDHTEKGKSEGTHSLSNKELQEIITRMNLEKQYNTLRPKTANEEALKFIKKTLLDIGKQEASKFAAKEIAKLLAKATAGA